VATVASGLFWGRPLASDTPDPNGREMSYVRALWSWFREHRHPSWDRVHLQDTFMTPPRDQSLARSHVLALTLHETGLEAIGPFYGVVPAATARWMRSEFGALFGRGPRAGDAPSHIRRLVEEAAVTHVVTASSYSESLLTTMSEWAPEPRVGRFRIFGPPPAVDAPIPPRAPGPHPGDETQGGSPRSARRPPPFGSARAARFAIDTETDPAGAARLSIAFHPFWEIAEGPSGARVSRGRDGFLQVEGLAPGSHHLVLEYRPPVAWPASLAGWIGIAVLAFAPHRRRSAVRH